MKPKRFANLSSVWLSCCFFLFLYLLYYCNQNINVTTVFAYTIINSWLCQLLSCNFASLCVLDVSAVSRSFLAAIFPIARFTETSVFSATLQDFCCRITETSNFFSALCHFQVFFLCAQYPRPLEWVQPLLQSNISSNAKKLTPPQRHHLSSYCCFVLYVSAFANLSTPLSWRGAFLYSGGSWWNWPGGLRISSLVEHMGLSPWLFL